MAMRMPKAWPLLASTLNAQLGILDFNMTIKAVAKFNAPIFYFYNAFEHVVRPIGGVRDASVVKRPNFGSYLIGDK
ncbi:MAG: hypothetical protein A3G29_06580 [Burkholderiales bacterium RIFCSPLOWO2_12_FULL_64_99]|nr:MAG: hypothetical protein A3G29_06580 [Burkholderiales bacterium RIFCSPLOWO2_12_FULL_64_99]